MLPCLSFPFLHVFLHEGHLCTLEAQWLGQATGPELREALLQTRQLALQHGVRGWIADDRRLGSVHPQDLNWVRDEMLLPLGQAGLQRFAIIESEKILGRMTIEALRERVAPLLPFEISHFDDVELARVWASGRA